MRTLRTLGVVAALHAGASIGACGATGASTSTDDGTPGTGTAGTAGGGTSSVAGGPDDRELGFEGGPSDAPMSHGDACGSMKLEAHTNPGNLIVVFDQSGSMSQPFDAEGASGRKWRVAADAIVAAVVANQAMLNVGAIFFPTKATGNVCSFTDPIGTPPQIPIEPGSMFTAHFQAHFTAPGWALMVGTPLKDALDRANAAFLDPSTPMGARAVVIITDGAPTCITGQAAILGPVHAMFSRGIKTHAVGLPGSASASTLLDAIATAGGTGSTLSPTDPAALRAALAQISSSTIDRCTIKLDSPPSDPSKVHLLATDGAAPAPYEVPLGADGGDGWTLASDGTTVTLLGSVCDKARDGTYTSLEFIYGCPTVTPR